MDLKDKIIAEQAKIIAEQAKTIEKLQLIIAKLSTCVAELEKRLGKDSSNSSKPPSSDGLSKPSRTNSLRENGKNKSGGQPGHPGGTLRQIEAPDKVVHHPLTCCPVCITSLESGEVVKVIKRQVFDIPLPKMEVTEHQAEVKFCGGCKKRVMAKFPHGVNAPVQYGEVIQSFSVYFQQQQLIPEDRLQATLSDLFKIDLATGTLNHFSESVYGELAVFDEKVLSKIKEEAVKHLDETGFRIGGKTQWLHVAATDSLTYYHTSTKRKSLIEGMKGIIVHDHWKPYYRMPDVEHALCNQHHLRELQSLIENEKEVWAKKMWRFLRFALRYRHAYEEEAIPAERLIRLKRLYRQIIREGIRYHKQLPEYAKKSQRGRTAKRTGYNLVLRLWNYRADVLRFLTNLLVPFTNNQAERDLRMMKCKQKISGGFRSEKGAQIFSRIRGFISTARKQGWNVFESIQQVIRGCTPMPA